MTHEYQLGAALMLLLCILTVFVAPDLTLPLMTLRAQRAAEGIIASLAALIGVCFVWIPSFFVPPERAEHNVRRDILHLNCALVC